MRRRLRTVERSICYSLPAPTNLVRREAAPATKVTLHLTLPFIAVFPLHERPLAPRPPIHGAWPAAERVAELDGGRWIHTAAIRGPLPMGRRRPWAGVDSEAFGAQVVYVDGKIAKAKRGK